MRGIKMKKNPKTTPAVADLLSCAYDQQAQSLLVLYSDKRLVSLRLSALKDLPNSALCGWQVDEFRRGIELQFENGGSTSFSSEFALYTSDSSYRAAVQLEHGGETLGLAARSATRIKAARLAKGWSMAELGRRAQMAAPNIHRVESGKHQANFSTLERLAAALGLKIAELVAG
jgi:DNA-binding Xre family transcriptional regulator